MSEKASPKTTELTPNSTPMEDDFDPLYEVYSCDLCGVHVHKGCYRRDLMHSRYLIDKDKEPNEDEDITWFCQRCDHLLRNSDINGQPEAWAKSKDVKCFLCDDLSGVIIKVYKGQGNTSISKNLTETEKEIQDFERQKLWPNRDQKWVHVTCVNWIPQLYFEEREEKKDGEWFSGTSGRIKGNSLPRYLFDGKPCCLCLNDKQVRIKCDYKACMSQFHVRCAIEAGIIRETNLMRPDTRKGQEHNVLVYCALHDAQAALEELQSANQTEIQSEKTEDIKIETKVEKTEFTSEMKLQEVREQIPVEGKSTDGSLQI